MPVLEFPTHKKLEKQLKDLEIYAEDIFKQAEYIQKLITEWEDQYLQVGEEYFKAGGKDPEIASKYVFLKGIRSKFGIF
jgi:hypothetical protein